MPEIPIKHCTLYNNHLNIYLSRQKIHRKRLPENGSDINLLAPDIGHLGLTQIEDNTFSLKPFIFSCNEMEHYFLTNIMLV